MRTEKQIAASRANGAKSRGPKPRPANRWADYRTLGEALLIEGESPGLFDDLATEFAEHFRPESPIDHLLIGNMLAAHWRKTRLWRRNQQNGDSIGIEESRLDRQFYRAYDRYMKSRLNSPREEPANNTPVSTCENSGPAPEPTETQPKPGETRPEPGQPDDTPSDRTTSRPPEDRKPRCNTSLRPLPGSNPVRGLFGRFLPGRRCLSGLQSSQSCSNVAQDSFVGIVAHHRE